MRGNGNMMDLKRLMEDRKELCEEGIDMYKSSLRMNVFILVMTTVVAIWLIAISIHYCIEGDWLFAVLELLLAVMNGGLGLSSLGRIKLDKKSIKREKANLEKIDSEIKFLEEHVNEYECEEIQ